MSQKIKRCGGYKLDCTCMCLCFYPSIHPSIYHGGALVNHQCQAAEWEMFYKCCLSGGRRPSPGGFNHPPNPPHPDSLHPSISPSVEVLMSSGEVGAEKEREKRQNSANEVIKSCSVCVCVWVRTIYHASEGMQHVGFGDPVSHGCDTR